MPLETPKVWVGRDSPNGREHAVESPASAVGLCGANVTHPEKREWPPDLATACGECWAKVEQRRADTED